MRLPDPMQRPELFYALVARRHSKGLPALPGHRVAEDRHLEMLRLRLCEGLPLSEIGERAGVGPERVRQLLDLYFDVQGIPPAARRQAAPDEEPRAASIAFGQRMRRLRAEHDISQHALASRTGIHPTTIGRLEHGSHEPRLTTILSIARGLGVQPGALLDEHTTGTVANETCWWVKAARAR